MSATHVWQADTRARMRTNKPERREDVSRPKVDLSRLREVKVTCSPRLKPGAAQATLAAPGHVRA
jgi:hypothetical protein